MPRSKVPQPAWRIACDAAELLVDCSQAAAEIGLEVDPVLVSDPASELLQTLGRGAPGSLATHRTPEPATLVDVAYASRRAGQPAALCVLGEPDSVQATVPLAGDLGLAAVDEVRPLLSVLALLQTGAKEPWRATARGLPEVDRRRLAMALRSGKGVSARLSREHRGLIGWSDGKRKPVLIGEARDVAQALSALQASSLPPARKASILEGVDPRSALEVLFGPARALSDPASKSALAPYGISVPAEELCTSPSRAAAEASRLGYPVRLALASPDLRVWDHPDLTVDGVDNAARVRDVFRQMMNVARTRKPAARLLGITVAATTVARAYLRIVATPLPERLVLCELGFADPHGVASGDHTLTVLPAPPSRVGRVLGRLAGAALISSGTRGERTDAIEAISDLLLRLAAFVSDRSAEVTSVEIDPLALLVGGGVEAREACITVGDAFTRSLERSASGY